MRTRITILTIIIYALSYSLFLVKYFACTDIGYRIWVNATFGLFVTFLFFDKNYKVPKEQYHHQWNNIGFATFIINFALIIFFYLTDGLTGIGKLIIFNGSILVLTLMIRISGGRHGLFKD